MKTMKHTLALLVSIGLALITISCTTAVPTDTPGVDELGKYLMRQEGPEIDTVVGFRYAASSIGQDWLLLELAITSPTGATGEVKRENVWVRTPDGTKIEAAAQKLFGEAYGGLRSNIQQANVARDPMDYFPPNREACTIQFFVAPGGGVSYDTVTVNDRRACEGRLFFKVPGGVDPGRWTFGIDLEESTVRIPFDL